MNSTQVREHGGLKLWLLLVAIGVALGAALGLGTMGAQKAWADGTGKSDDPITTADQLATLLKGDQYTNDVDVSGGVVTVTGTIDNLSGKQSGDSGNDYDIYIAPVEPITLTVNGTINLAQTHLVSLRVAGGTYPLTINGTGKITSYGNAIAVKYATTGTASAILDGGINIMVQPGNTAAAVVVSGGDQNGSQSVLTINNANITGPNGAVLVKTGTATINGGKLSATQSSAPALQAGVNVTVGTAAGAGPEITSAAGPAIDVFYDGNLTINGGTIKGATAGVQVNNNSNQNNIESGGNPPTYALKCTINGGNISATSGPGINAISTGKSGSSTGQVNIGSIDLAVKGGTVTPGVDQSGESYPALQNQASNPSGSGVSDKTPNSLTVGNEDGTGPTMNGDIVNGTNGEGEVSVQGGSVEGNVKNESNKGGMQISGNAQISGTIQGNVDKVTPPADPGTAEALQGAVIGVKAPVIAAMAPYATVTVNSAGNVWNVEVVDGAEATPVSTIASTLVVPIVNAIASASSPSVTSVQNGALTITLPNTADEVLSFSQGVLEAAVVNTNTNPAAPATLGELEGLTCGISAATNTGSVTYTFNFAGEAPEPPAASYEAVYRLYNPYDFLHIYTRDANEVNTLKAQGWTVDFNGQPCWYAPVAGSEDASYQVIRLYNPYSHDHYFVPASDTDQIDELTGLGWRKDSAASAIWSAPAGAEGSVEVYTLFNRYNQVDTHLWTASKTEVDTLVGPDAWELNATTMWGVTPA